MEFTLWFLVLTVLWKSSSSVRCFRCSPEYNFFDESQLLCQHFDGSEKYIVNCDKSTMCFKKVTTYILGNGITSVNVLRDCASQSLGKENVRENGRWEQKVVIHDDVYEEDCIEERSETGKLTTSVNCYCRGDHCNGSIANIIDLKTILLTIFIYFLQFS